MARFQNIGVNLRRSLCGGLMYASAQRVDFLDYVKNCAFLNWKLTRVQISFMDRHQLIERLYGPKAFCHSQGSFINLAIVKHPTGLVRKVV